MSDEQKYTIQGLDEYIRQGEPQQRERSEAWKVGLTGFRLLNTCFIRLSATLWAISVLGRQRS